jgi:hypothetical protein
MKIVSKKPKDFSDSELKKNAFMDSGAASLLSFLQPSGIGKESQRFDTVDKLAKIDQPTYSDFLSWRACRNGHCKK